MRPGGVVLELNDGPVIVLKSAYPLYRDLAFGSIGDDVARLQNALRGAGYGIYDTRGGTDRPRLLLFYANAGYAPSLEVIPPSEKNMEQGVGA